MQASQISSTTGRYLYNGITRPSAHQATWSQEGTREWPPQVTGRRYLCHYTTRGNPEFIAPVPTGSMSGRWYWLTQAPVGFPFTYLRTGLDLYTEETAEEYDQDW